jgi:hypothetical protein
MACWLATWAVEGSDRPAPSGHEAGAVAQGEDVLLALGQQVGADHDLAHTVEFQSAVVEAAGRTDARRPDLERGGHTLATLELEAIRVGVIEAGLEQCRQIAIEVGRAGQRALGDHLAARVTRRTGLELRRHRCLGTAGDTGLRVHFPMAGIGRL